MFLRHLTRRPDPDRLFPQIPTQEEDWRRLSDSPALQECLQECQRQRQRLLDSVCSEPSNAFRAEGLLMALEAFSRAEQAANKSPISDNQRNDDWPDV